MAAVNGPRWSIFARAYGMETEYGLTCQINHKDGSIEMGDSIVAAKMLLTDYDHVSTFVSTGGRLYLDGETCTLCHVEYATPECLTPLSVALSHHAPVTGYCSAWLLKGDGVGMRSTSSETTGTIAAPLLAAMRTTWFLGACLSTSLSVAWFRTLLPVRWYLGRET